MTQPTGTSPRRPAASASARARNIGSGSLNDIVVQMNAQSRLVKMSAFEG